MRNDVSGMWEAGRPERTTTNTVIIWGSWQCKELELEGWVRRLMQKRESQPSSSQGGMSICQARYGLHLR